MSMVKSSAGSAARESVTLKSSVMLITLARAGVARVSMAKILAEKAAAPLSRRKYAPSWGGVKSFSMREVEALLKSSMNSAGHGSGCVIVMAHA